ncbi:MAG: hypothetical protein GX130_07480 [Candidatus Hydrogenedens sp.]|jgi:hypothetical protein|nr:hypothetical protein [Candidatus Hydrogenedens sp.]
MSTTITFNGQILEVPCAEDGRIEGSELKQALGLQGENTLYRPSQEGHELIHDNDTVHLQPGDELGATPRFITAAKDYRRLNVEIKALERAYGSGRVLWPKMMDWVVIRGYSVPKGYNKRHIDLAIMIPGNYGYGAPIRDCFIDADLEYGEPGHGKTIDHYFPYGYIPGEKYRDWANENWAYLCLHMTEWKDSYSIYTYMKLVRTFLSHPEYDWPTTE